MKIAIETLTDIPGWTEGIIAAVAIFIVGYLVLRKIKPILKDLMEGLDFPTQLNKAVVNFFFTIILIFIVGRTLRELPQITSPELVPLVEVGGIMTSLVNRTFSMLVPIALIFVGYYLYSKE